MCKFCDIEDGNCEPISRDKELKTETGLNFLSGNLFLSNNSSTERCWTLGYLVCLGEEGSFALDDDIKIEYCPFCGRKFN